MTDAELEILRAEASALIKSNGYIIRSCWNCNTDHDDLKSIPLLCCFNCDRWYYKGVDISKEDEIPSDD